MARRLPQTGGYWDDIPGESIWYSNKPDVNKLTQGSGVPFKKGFPDFSAWEKGKISLPNMTGKKADFREADKLFAEQQGWLFKNGTPNGAASARFRQQNQLTWHHVEDGQTMQLVPTALHGNTPHLGGASLKKAGKI
ncbi:HNH endonuclease [Alkalinema sp. FACHB-956]|uniref:HNH endonuclease n=1 Tax=Alkalinema sp. FACHB-956 TaxID=2692768 RepID=UPI001689153E|nr:HNH endonuclease [Alkalinema sp. FACHB-956]MBD2325999.1 HNH endonuclease [Alkalinema sp. FACHB-956]